MPGTEEALRKAHFPRSFYFLPPHPAKAPNRRWRASRDRAGLGYGPALSALQPHSWAALRGRSPTFHHADQGLDPPAFSPSALPEENFTPPRG